MTPRRTGRLATGGLLVVLAFVLSACAQNAPQDSLDPAGPYARTIDTLFRPVFWIATGVFVLVEGLLVVAMIKFRARGNDDVPTQVHGNRRLEIMWTVAPALLLAVIAVPTVATIFSLDRRPSGALDIEVIGHQFWFEINYPTLGVATANEVHIPVGQPAFITLKSFDVIHSFWVPRLAGKQDLVPGSEEHLKVLADEPGLYEGQCAEYCGASHANMQFAVVAQTQAEFDAWVQQQTQPAPQPPPDVLAAMQRTGVSCGGCHTIDGVEGFGGTIGPNLTHFAGRSKFAGWIFANDDRELLFRWLKDAPSQKPGIFMPSFAQQLSDQEVDALVTYLQSLD